MNDLLSKHDARARSLFVTKVKSTLSRDFWTNDVGDFLDRG